VNQEYDNNNRGACWPIDKAKTVTAEIGHRKFYGALVRTNATATNAPSHNLYLRCQDKPREVYCVAIFKSDKDGDKLAGGELTMVSSESFWVSLFKNKSEKERSPDIDLSFQPKEARSQEQPDEIGYDDETFF